MKFTWKSFTELTTNELYSILKLRVDVFIVEQKCAYKELDNQDQTAYHLMVTEKNNLTGYARVLHEKGHLLIGRIVTHYNFRGIGLGKQIIQQAIEFCENTYPNQDIHISAQAHLEQYYKQFGFITTSSQPYDWDGILHVDMVSMKE